MSSSLIINTPCTVVTGFLGAGKTTLINQLLKLKPQNDIWALLINEFGQIGIDAALIEQKAQQDRTDKSINKKIVIKEVSGGCICCTSQLPLQIAISRLLTEAHPARLVIEPTGAAHPKALIEQLSAPHWQSALQITSVICVLNARQWRQEKYQSQKDYQAHVKFADVVAINRFFTLNHPQKKQLCDWLYHLNPNAELIWLSDYDYQHLQFKLIKTASNNLSGKSLLLFDTRDNMAMLANTAKLSQMLNKPSTISHQLNDASAIRIALTQSSIKQTAHATPSKAPENINLPYRYHNQQNNFSVGGWRLPANWQLPLLPLQEWLIHLPNWQRIKGVVHTKEGWYQLNFTPDSLSTAQTTPQIDNRIEVILENTNVPSNHTVTTFWQHLWAQWDSELMAMVRFN